MSNKISNKIRSKLKTQSTVSYGCDADLLNCIIETLRKIYDKDKDFVEDILENVVFIYCSEYAISKEWKYKGSLCSIIFNIEKILKKYLKKNNKLSSKVNDIVAHECAHYLLGHYKVRSTRETEKQADDLIEGWGFQRLYPELVETK